MEIMSIKRGGVRRFMENSILNFHFICLSTSLKTILVTSIPPKERGHYVKKFGDFHCVSPLDLDRLHAVHTLEDSWIA